MYIMYSNNQNALRALKKVEKGDMGYSSHLERAKTLGKSTEEDLAAKYALKIRP